ncbi:MAG: hypothetical protein J6M47_05490 [Clostridia bacterium]|nr:hypothetical protein [Clostridia bacterium]
MYKSDRAVIVGLFLCTLSVALWLEIDYIAIASEVISIVSIASAVYFAAYAGIQSNEKFAEKLKRVVDPKNGKSELYTINAYLKTALGVGIVSIICSIVMILLREQVSWYDMFQKNFRAHIYHVLSACSLGLFAINIPLMIRIVQFIVVRIAYGE